MIRKDSPARRKCWASNRERFKKHYGKKLVKFECTCGEHKLVNKRQMWVE